MEESHLPVNLQKKINLAQLRDNKVNLRRGGLHTVCEEARCPNITECFRKKTATFMILGNTCTRGCGFCNVTKGVPDCLNESEPEVLANTVKKMGLRYVVITSVTRDDLEDGGAGMFMKTAGAIKSAVPDAKVEVLTPDFNGNLLAWEIISASKIDVFSHNIETVPRLYRIVRPGADYKRSLTLLNFIHKSRKDVIIKSGLMVGLGENVQEVKDALMDLKEAGCDIVTIGQYLRPSMKSLEIDRFVSDREFEEYVFFGKKIGLDFVFSGPFVRSSYRAEEVFHQIMCQRGNSSRVQD